MIGYVYEIVCPITNEPIYIGSTKNHPRNRFSTHISSVKTSELPMYEYFRANNSKPIFNVIEYVKCNDDRLIRKSEGAWIKAYKELGYNLFNKQTPKGTRNRSLTIMVSEEVYYIIEKMAKEENRTLGKQADYLLKLAISQFYPEK
jgi:hypothetical protein